MHDNSSLDSEGRGDKVEAAPPDALERLLMQRALGQSEQPGLAARTLGEIERRALARQFLARRGAMQRLLTPRERTTLSAVAAGTTREISGAALGLLHLVSAPALRSTAAALIGAACGYCIGLSLHGLALALALAVSPSAQFALHPALLLGLLGALAGGLSTQAARVRAYMQ